MAHRCSTEPAISSQVVERVAFRPLSWEADWEILLRMSRLKPTTRLLLMLMCVLAVSLRVSGAHLHLCLDGGEPPAALHLQSEGDSHHAEGAHNDIDVSLAGQPLFKNGGLDLDPLVVIAFVHGLVALPVYGVAPSWRQLNAIVIPSSPFLRPPLRGPPPGLPA